MFWSRTSEVKENFPKGLNFATVAIDGKAGFDFSMVRLLYEGELKLELSPRRSCWAPLCRGKARTKYPWVHVLSLLGFAAQFLVEDILLGGGHSWDLGPQLPLLGPQEQFVRFAAETESLY